MTTNPSASGASDEGAQASSLQKPPSNQACRKSAQQGSPLSGRSLIRATRVYAQDRTGQSWFVVLSTLGLLSLAFAGAVAPWAWPLRLVSSILMGLLIVRLFVIYHDHQHQAILPKSRIAEQLMRAVGLICLAPSSVWRHTHNTHHAQNSKLHSDAIGSFRVMTRERWQNTGFMGRLDYLVHRHPLTICLGYLTAFFHSMCVAPFLENPREHYDGLLAVVLHIVLATAVTFFLGWPALILGVFVPFLLASAIGTYLFYAQHNFPTVHLKDEDGWTFEGAAIESSSFMRMPRWLHWFTANIGYHHIHHLNHRIPFYRLPEAFRSLPELQQAKTTSLHPREILACLRLKLWCVERQRLVGLRE